ncbi:hypothetical protein SAMN02745195_00807 [Thermoanaerobacter uzonensis DSM 18761]|uniref:Uncharacterized protein n=1 Tax=Thermoanaerobacter uzonensis DSM 18761 TaxID=1123369 RepID=A0A1M4V1E4_9THEO|nr:hypothetical protein [Thermoanaerobacter uzonensis]SHE62806.1 hypothetical protein SAMN02745195_00807 [Thermoanaerobacter uzonensis DSM 18761]
MGKRVKRKKYRYIDSESILVILIMLGLLSIAITQLLMTNDNMKVFLSSTQRLEGINLNSNLSQEGKVTIEVVEKDKTLNSFVLLDGEPVTNFPTKSITITVRPNQILEIDGTREKESLHFKVVAVSENVIEPQNTTVVKVDKNIQKICMIRLK